MEGLSIEGTAAPHSSSPLPSDGQGGPGSSPRPVGPSKTPFCPPGLSTLVPPSSPVSDGWGAAHLWVLRVTSHCRCSQTAHSIVSTLQQELFIRGWSVGPVWAGTVSGWSGRLQCPQQRAGCPQAGSHSHFLSTYFHTGMCSLLRPHHCN